MRSEQEREQIRSLLRSPQWRTIQDVANEVCAKLKNEAEAKGTEWETISTFLLADGGAKGIIRFMQELGKEANHEHEN